MKILNLYAGIGGNRKLWEDKHNITAIEIDENIANIYLDYFPDDFLKAKVDIFLSYKELKNRCDLCGKNIGLFI